MAEEHGGSKRDAGRKPSGRRAERPKKSGDDPHFEEFLQKQFAQLKRELAEYAPFEAAKEGKVLSFEDRISRPKKSRGGWTVGIAAVVLAAIAVPMVIQLNRQKAEVAFKTETPSVAGDVTLGKEKPKAEKEESAAGRSTDARARLDDLEAQDGTYYKNAPAKTKKAAKAEETREQGERNLKATREEASPKDAIATGKADKPAPVHETETKTIANAVREGDADRFAAKKESARVARPSEKSGYTMADKAPAPAPARPAQTAPAAPAAAPAPTLAKSRSAPANEISGGDRSAAAQAEMPAPAAEAQAASRSIQVDDAKSRLKQQDIVTDEKAEMEKLWKEFEQDPKSFNQDKKRSARLRTLLSRHNEKSRAKRMKSSVK